MVLKHKVGTISFEYDNKTASSTQGTEYFELSSDCIVFKMCYVQWS